VVSPHHPVKIAHRTGHAHVLNSMALGLVGLTRYTADPEGGFMERDLHTGELTGVLYEMGGLLAERVPRLGHEDMEQGVKEANLSLLSHGITSLHDASWRNNLELCLGLKIVLDETTGELCPPRTELNRMVMEAHGLGLQVAIHAVEKAAIESACSAVQEAPGPHTQARPQASPGALLSLP
jgi:predicted amidohydrolase YtcJ